MYDVLDWLIWGRQSHAWQYWIYGKEKPLRGKHMEECVVCQSVFGPGEFNGVRELRTFRGYTVDLKLREFRKVPRKSPPEFIDFDSRKGQRLLVGMHQAATDLLNRKVAKLA